MDSRTYSRRVEEFLEKMRNGQPVSSKSSKSWTIPLDITYMILHEHPFVSFTAVIIVLTIIIIILRRAYQAICMVCGVTLLNFVFFLIRVVIFWLMIKFWMKNMVRFHATALAICCYVDVDSAPKFLILQMYVNLITRHCILMSHQSRNSYYHYNPMLAMTYWRHMYVILHHVLWCLFVLALIAMYSIARMGGGGCLCADC